MKVDLVVNTMLQQVDRNLQVQMNPAAAFRAGEMLRGQVTTQDGRTQIRLGNGMLFNALPSDGVLLNNNEFVTLRVTGNRNGTVIMQLIAQETQLQPQQANLAQVLQRMGIPTTEQSLAVLGALERMQVEPEEGMVRAALDALERFPELGPDKAAFLAANRITANRQNVDALIRLIDDRAMVGTELDTLTDMLRVQLSELMGDMPDTDAARVARQEGEAQEQAAQPKAGDVARQSQPASGGAPHTAGESPQTEQPQAPAGQPGNAAARMATVVLTPADAMPGGAGEAPAQTSAPQGQPIGLEQTASPQGQTPAAPAQNFAPQTQVVPAQGQALPMQGQAAQAQTFIISDTLIDAPLQPSPSQQPAEQVAAQPMDILLQQPMQQDGMPAPQESPARQLMSLVQLTQGSDGRFIPVLGAISAAGLDEEALALALGLPTMPEGEAQEATQAFLQRLPPQVRQQAQELLQAIADSVQVLMGSAEPQEAPHPGGLSGIIREVSELFVGMDGALDQKLEKAAAGQHEKLAALATQLEASGMGDRDAAQQMGRVASQVRLIHDISQYVYQQIPMQINERNRTVELYVMKRGKSKKIDPENANILIALDTENLGHLETMVNVNKKSVRLRFGVEHPALVGYLNGYLPDIDAAMKAIGYRLSDMRMQVTAEPVNPITVAEIVEPEHKPGALDIKL